MKKWAKICLVAMLVLAIPPLANLGVSLPGHSDLSSKPHDVNAYSKGDSIRVSESVSVVVNGKPYGTPSSSSNSPSGDFDQLNIITVKENSNSVTTMDKIFNSERLRFNGRTLVKYNPMQGDTYGEKLSTVGNIMAQESDKNPELVSGKISDMSSVVFSGLHSGAIFSGQGEDLPEQLLKLVQDQDYAKYSALLVIVPISGSVLICVTNPKIAARSKSVCSFVFMIILVSSIVTTPMSISGNYVRQAFAEQENNTNQSNSTQPLSFNNFSNSTQPLSFNNFSNSTQPLSFNNFSNSTQPLSFNNFSNSTQPNFAGFSNSTQVATVPNATKSWTFGDANNGTTSVGEVGLQNVANSSALSLQGNGYLTENVNSTKSLNHLTLSAWVKPDYTQGSPQFTIMSAEKQFVLSINNLDPPAKLATFSIFDGIKWDTVNSTVPIGGNWANIAATFNGSSIGLYVNGTLQSSLDLNNVLTIQVDGKIGTKAVGNVTSNGNIVIGAYYDTTRQESINKFSGLISGVNLYDYLLTPDQISQLYNQSMPSFYPALANASNSTSLNMTSMVNPSINQTQSSYLITQSPQFQFQYISDGNFTRMAHHFRHGNMTQYNGWHDSNATINVQVIGPDGIPFVTKSTFKEIREGKFDIQLSSAKAAKPGLYKVKLTMVKNGKIYTAQEQYQWGLVSVNTQKSIYRPGETANFIIAVLDNGGQSVCNANIAMRITDPLGGITRMTSGNGITPESQCGLYDANYTTTSAGNYTVHIVAQNPSGVAYFGTSFVAQNFYPFDITRTAASKIDPIDNPNSFNVQLDFGSYTNATQVSIQESVPSSFNVTTDGAVQTVGDSKILTWNKDLIGNKTSVQYTYSVPLQYPQLYALGPAQITYGNNQTFTEARPWFVAVDPSREISVNSGTATTSPLNFAITVPSSATHTVGVVSVIVDSANSISGIGVTAGTNTACSTGTQTFTLLSGSAATRDHNQIGLWNFTAPSTSDTNICVSWTGTATRVDAGFIAVNGTTLGGTIRQANATSGTGTALTTVALPSSVSGGDLIIDAAADINRTNAISPSDVGHTKLWSQVTTFSAGGGSKNATGADVLQWSPTLAANVWLASAVAIERPLTSSAPSDIITVSDKASTGQNPKDKISITDNPVVTTGSLHSVTVQDSLASKLSDKATTGKLVQDSLASKLSDKVEPGSLVRDTVTVTDSASIPANTFHSVTVQDSLASKLSDKATTGTLVKDTVTVTDSASSLAGVFHSSTVQDSLASQLSDEVESGTLVKDTVTVTDSASSLAGVFHSSTVQDSLASNLSDKVEPGNLVEDTVTVTDLPQSVASKKISLAESLSTNDAIQPTHQSLISLADTIRFTDSFVYPGRINLEARDQNNNLISGATYTISPNPNGGNTPLTVVDGGANDHDGINNGRSVVASVPFGSYIVTMTGIPSGYNVLGNSTSYSVSSTQVDGTIVFKTIPASMPLNNLGTTVITTQPSLNSTTLDTWQSSFNATKISGTNSSTINTAQSLPPIISAGINNASAVNTAVSSQATVQLQTSFTSATNGTTVINTIGAPVYYTPQSSDVVAVIPSIVATTNPATVSSETVSTPPLDSIIPGQQMIIPVSQSAIPATGGIKQLNVQSASSASSVGNSTDWFVIHVDNTLSTSLPALPSSDKLSLYVQVMYPFEETGQGFDWNNPNNFAVHPELTLQLPKNPSGVQTDSNGCPVSDIYLYDTSSQSWTTSGVKVLSAVPTVGNSNTCDVTVQVPHFSQFALGGRSTSLGGGSSSVSSSSGAGGGAVGTGPASSGIGASSDADSDGAFGGELLPQLTIDNVSYDICKNNTATIVVGTDSDQIPSVILRSSISGVVSAQLDANQPFLTQNDNATIKKYMYIVSLSPQEKSFEVVALLAENNNVNTVGQTIDVTTCKANISFEASGAEIEQQPVDLSAPGIFDTKFQIANGTKVSSTDTTNQYVDNQPLTVYAIVNSPTPITKSEIRYVQAGQDLTQYSTIEMNVAPLQVSNTTYVVSGTIPAETMHAPAVSYWVDVQNTAGKTSDSDVYSVGVSQDQPLQAKLEIDTRFAKTEGSLRQPQAYFTNNGTSPVYGYIALFVNGSQVSASQPQLFGLGQTQVSLEWHVPSVGSVEQYALQARAEIYGQAITTQSMPVIAFPGTITAPLSKLGTISSMLIGNQTVADAHIIHSSFKHDSTVRYKVVSPDGTCVIGADSGCLVTNSTVASVIGSKTVTVDGQLYQVRYSGANSTLERFSITSVDPISGQWKVEVESNNSALQAQLMNSVLVQVKYSAQNSPVITLSSK